jgi:uncharacterized protein YeaO (DUF488 family)
MPFRIKRAYDPVKSSDGIRVLVDRLWPRGLSKARAKLDHWEKDVAPSDALRRWFGHKPERFSEFRRRYKKELASNAALAELRKLGKAKTVTLLYSAHDPLHNQAQVLLSLLRRKSSKRREKAMKTSAPSRKAS